MHTRSQSKTVPIQEIQLKQVPIQEIQTKPVPIQPVDNQTNEYIQVGDSPLEFNPICICETLFVNTKDSPDIVLYTQCATTGRFMRYAPLTNFVQFMERLFDYDEWPTDKPLVNKCMSLLKEFKYFHLDSLTRANGAPKIAEFRLDESTHSFILKNGKKLPIIDIQNCRIMYHYSSNMWSLVERKTQTLLV
jgi:hypothetical protein